MALNPQYDAIGKAFVQQYYTLFDDAAQRHQLVNLYNANESLMTFEGVQMQGAPKIMEKISSLTFQRIAHSITAIDCQPMFDGGILINVLGQLKVMYFAKFCFIESPIFFCIKIPIENILLYNLILIIRQTKILLIVFFNHLF